MANSYLEANMTGNTASTKMTFSCWIKINKVDEDGRIFGAQANACHAYFNGDGRLNIDFAAKDSSSVSAKLLTNRKFRDPNAFYHIVFALDTTLGTADDRIKLWVNGVQETAFDTRTNPGQNDTYAYGQSGYYNVGARSNNTGSAGHYFEGYISHAAYVDGSALAPTVFGQTDSTSGIWKFKSPTGVTWGDNGFHLKFENSGNLGLDSSGEGNNFTTNGNLKQAIDNPSNSYATINPLDYWYRNPVLSIGNTKIVDTTGWSGARSTFGFSTGKWYWEIKLSGSSMDNHIHGVQLVDVNTRTQDPQQITGTTVFYNHDGGEMRTDGTQTTADYGTFSSGDIMGVAVDMTAGSYGQITIYKNGSAIVSNFNLSSSSTTVMPFSAVGNCTTEYNFGNGLFGTTAITSAGSNGNGSLFEYDVPSGHYALNTKNLNTYG